VDADRRVWLVFVVLVSFYAQVVFRRLWIVDVLSSTLNVPHVKFSDTFIMFVQLKEIWSLSSFDVVPREKALEFGVDIGTVACPFVFSFLIRFLR